MMIGGHEQIAFTSATQDLFDPDCIVETSLETLATHLFRLVAALMGPTLIAVASGRLLQHSVHLSAGAGFRGAPSGRTEYSDVAPVPLNISNDRWENSPL